MKKIQGLLSELQESGSPEKLSVGGEELEVTRVLHCLSLSSPLQCSCLENPRDGGAWWAAVYGSHRVRHDWSDLAATDFSILWGPQTCKCGGQSCNFQQGRTKSFLQKNLRENLWPGLDHVSILDQLWWNRRDAVVLSELIFYSCSRQKGESRIC